MAALEPVPLDDTPATDTDAAPHTVAFQVIEDPAAFFRLSSAIDMLRDSARILLDAGVTAPASVERLRNQYTTLRAALRDTVTDDGAASQDVITPRLGDDDSEGAAGGDELGVADVFQAASMLARWADSLVNTPGFLANRSLHLTTIEAAIAKNASSVPPAAGGAGIDRGVGSYL